MGETTGTPDVALSDDRPPRRSVRPAWRRFVWWTALLAVIGVSVPAAARLTGWEPGPVAWLVALMPWFTLATVVPLALAALARSWKLALAAAGLAALGVGWLMPLYVARGGDGDTVLTVATVNLAYGEADADAVVRLVEESSVDVLAVQELTAEAVSALRDAGLEEQLPHSVLAPEPGFRGTGLWSRLRLVDTQSLDAFSSRAVRADVTIASREVTVFAIHPEAPALRRHPTWSADLDRLASLLADQMGPVMVAGDFNTTRDHEAFRRLEALGYADAADDAGAGFLPTFPDGRRLGPLVAIDHVMTRDADLVAQTVVTVSIPGTDHRALVVDYAAR